MLQLRPYGHPRIRPFRANVNQVKALKFAADPWLKAFNEDKLPASLIRQRLPEDLRWPSTRVRDLTPATEDPSRPAKRARSALPVPAHEEEQPRGGGVGL